MNIVGIGQAGCAVALKFQKYPQYDIHCIDSKKWECDNYYEIGKADTHEEYEKTYPAGTLSTLEAPCVIILSGAGAISGVVLRAMEELRGKITDDVCIKPDLDNISEIARKRDRLTSQVLQQYARSALFKRLYLVENKKVEQALPGISIKGYWDQINETISSTYHMLNVFNNTEPLLTTRGDNPDSARIATFGLMDFETGKEKMFFDLQEPRTKLYYFGINNSYLEEDKDLLFKIRNMTSKNSSEKAVTAFSVYSTDYEHNYVYGVQCATLVQEQNIDF